MDLSMLLVHSEIVRIILQVNLLRDNFGFDEAFNYKEETDLNEALKRSVYYIYPVLRIP